MSISKVTITLDRSLVRQIDSMVQQQVYASRSAAVQAAVEEQVMRLRRVRLAEECAKLDPAEEQALAEQGMATEAVAWPAY